MNRLASTHADLSPQARPAAGILLPMGGRLGGYELQTVLGSGAMADVYLGVQTSLGRQVAIKVLRETGRRGGAGRDTVRDTSVERFMQEARAAASLVHGNIVQIYEVDCVDDVHFIAEEYVAGPTLKQWLQDRGPLSPQQAVSVLEQVAAALEAASRKRIVHRDIKPENLLVTPAGEVKVADFGLARITIAGEGLDLTHEGTTLGTPLYMSPEQVEGRELDSRSDLYSLGATVYHLLTGSPPFDASTPLAVALAHVRETPPPVATRRAELPVPLAALIDRLLAKSPDERPAGPGELLELIHGVAGELGGAGRSLQASLAWHDADAGAAWPSRERLAREASHELKSATSQLERAMLESRAAARPGRRFWLGVAAAGIAAFVVGLVIGRIRSSREAFKAENTTRR